MSQHDMVTENQSRTLFRQDAQSALQALASLNSGTGNPAVTYPYELKIDTSPLPAGNPLVYIRNGVNDAWVEWGYINKDTGRLWIKDVTGLSGLLADDQHVLDAEVLNVAEDKTKKGAASGYASLDATTKVPIAQVASGTPDGTKFIRDDRTLVVPTGRIIQVVNFQTGEMVTGLTTLIPYDNSVPENTEGDQLMEKAITPTNASNKLLVEVVVHMASNQDNNLSVALFQDAIGSALASSIIWKPADRIGNFSFKHYMTAGTIASTTFKLRGGGSSASQCTFNGGAGVGKHGGVLASSITITETVA